MPISPRNTPIPSYPTGLAGPRLAQVVITPAQCDPTSLLHSRLSTALLAGLAASARPLCRPLLCTSSDGPGLLRPCPACRTDSTPTSQDGSCLISPDAPPLPAPPPTR